MRSACSVKEGGLKSSFIFYRDNSNYGSIVKVNKLYPIIKEWKLYHRFSLISDKRFSLYFVKKRAFKVFSKEAKQDFYSVKRLLDKCFYILSDNDKDNNFVYSQFNHFDYNTHLEKKDSYFVLSFKNKVSLCIHCGLNTKRNFIHYNFNI